MRLASTLAVITIACGPRTTDGDDPQDEDTTADASGSSASGSSASGSSASGPSESTTTDDPETPSDSSGSETGAVACPPLPSTLTVHTYSACGDMSFIGHVDDFDAVVIVRAPPMVGMPWNEENTVDAVYELPDEQLDVRVLVGGVDATECDPEAEYPASLRTLVPVSGTLEVGLINIAETGCFFSCANGYALFRDAQFVDAACDADAPTVTLDLVELWGDIPPEG